MKKGLLESFEERLEQYKQPVDMSDIESGIVENEQYGKGKEGELIQELVETKDFTRRRVLTEQIKEIRETKKVADKEQLIQDMQSEQKEIQAKKEKLQEQVNAMESEKITVVQRIAETTSTLKLRRPDYKTYKSLTDDTEHMKKIQEKSEKLKTLYKKMENLENDYNKIDQVLKQLDGRKEKEEIEKQEAQRRVAEEKARQKEQTSQEDEMWTSYRQEQSDKESRKNAEEKFAWMKHDREQKSQEREGLQTEQEIEKYGSILTNEEIESSFPPIIEPQQTSGQTQGTRTSDFANNLRDRQRNIGNPNRMKPFNGQPNAKDTTEKPKEEPEEETKHSYKVTAVNLAIESVGLDEEGRIYRPVYTITAIDEENNEIVKKYDREKIVNSLEDKKAIMGNISTMGDDIYKVYDANLYIALQEFDKEFEMNETQKYVTQIKSVWAANFSPKEHIDLIYNLTNISQADLETDEKNMLKKIAKTSQKRGIAEYIKKPNILQRLFGKMKALTAAKPEKEVEEKPETAQERMARIQEEYEELRNEDEFEFDIFATDYRLSSAEKRELLAKGDSDFKANLKYEPKQIQSQDTRTEEVQAKKGPIHHGMIVDETFLDEK